AGRFTGDVRPRRPPAFLGHRRNDSDLGRGAASAARRGLALRCAGARLTLRSMSPPAAQISRWATAEKALFYALWLFVILVSVVDGYLAYRHRHEMQRMELNPLGLALIHWNGGRVWYLLAVKFAGTVVACALVLLIRQARPRIGLAVAAALA